ncbi:MAG: hypothetical protein IPJ40_23990 [Saprospirales bacterium]|nr:hypothetical protein [Saprospirales bacterium]
MPWRYYSLFGSGKFRDVGNYDWSLTPAIGFISQDGNSNVNITFTRSRNRPIVYHAFQ